MEPYRAIDRLLASLMKHQRQFNSYIHEINTHFGNIEEEERCRYFAHFIRAVTWYLRIHALQGYSETFLEIPQVFDTLTNMSNIRICMYSKEDIDRIIRDVKKGVAYDQDGEMAYVVEEDFQKGIFKAIRRVHQEHLAERKRRIWAIREELIATTLSPERAERIAAAHGMDPMDWLIANEGYELESY
jgi:hypothetical protein